MFMRSFVILVKVFSKNDTLNSGLDSCRVGILEMKLFKS